MADYALPASVLITALPILPYEPGIQAYRSRFTGQVDYSFSAPGSWRGSVSIALFDYGEYLPEGSDDIVEGTALASAMNALIAALRGGARTLALPLDGVLTIDEPDSATTVSSIDDVTGELTLNRDVEVPDGAFFTLGERLYQAVGSQSATNKIQPTPVFAAAEDERIRAATIIEVRMVGDDLGIPRTADFWGPWTFSWIEAV